jgi:hypothetical protein
VISLGFKKITKEEKMQDCYEGCKKYYVKNNIFDLALISDIIGVCLALIAVPHKRSSDNVLKYIQII